MAENPGFPRLVPVTSGSFSLYGVSLVAQSLKHLPAMQETWVQSLGWEDSLEKETATHSITEEGRFLKELGHPPSSGFGAKARGWGPSRDSARPGPTTPQGSVPPGFKILIYRDQILFQAYLRNKNRHKLLEGK